MVRQKGYTILILLFAISLLTIGLMVAVPVWNTQIQREKEIELIFRGKQVVEAVRLFLIKKPGDYPESLEELVEEKCLRRLYRDPMTKEGKWNIILLPNTPGQKQEGPIQKVLVVPAYALASFRLPRIIGVVSSSQKKSIKIFNNQESYDQWLFFYGQNPEEMPEISYFGDEK